MQKLQERSRTHTQSVASYILERVLVSHFLPQQTQVTVVHGAKEVSNATYPSKFRKALEKTFVDRGVQFVFGDYIDDFPSEAELQSAGAVTTRNGQKIPADLIVNSTGPLPATGMHTLHSSSYEDTETDLRYRFLIHVFLQLWQRHTHQARPYQSTAYIAAFRASQRFRSRRCHRLAGAEDSSQIRKP